METKMCDMCQSPMRLVPAGISKKSGKHYNAFYACQNPDCKHTLNLGEEGKPPKELNWPPKILKAEEDTKIWFKLLDLELKLDFIISKIKEKEEK